MGKFNYDKAEADLHDSGCHYSEEIYGHRSKRAIDSFMKENGLNPEKYYDEPKGRNNSHGNNNNNNSGNNNVGCYLTSACVKARNLPDDCEELMVLRNFRDTYLKKRENGEEEIKHYYESAPRIVQTINGLKDADAIWNSLYEALVQPCVKDIKNNALEAAYERYKAIATKLEEEYCR